MPNSLLPSAIDGVLTPPPSQRRKQRSVIVDVSLNDAGQQVYEVHGVTRGARKRAMDQQNSPLDERVAKRTAVRTILAPQSPDSLKTEDEDSEEQRRSTSSSELNIWNSEVETAFEEALRTIPKNGLTKIKISGKSCGRNELVSDYIMQKTGQLRTRKQVSSHIQVIKNSKKRTELIQLINHGPVDPDAAKRFDGIFTEIFFQRSLGSGVKSTPKHKTGSSRKQPSRRSTCGALPKRPYRPVECTIKSFEMSNSDGFVYTTANPTLEPPLRLKKDATVQNRFPSLHEYFNHDADPDRQITIIHNLVKLRLLEKARTPQTMLDIELKGVDPDESVFGCKTVIYCFGNEVLNINDDLAVVSQCTDEETQLSKVTLSLPFATEFWLAFFQSTENNVNNLNDPTQSENQKTMGVKGLTMKQVVYHKSSPLGYEKSDIKSLILWEFTRGHDSNQTTTRRLFLPTGGVPSTEPTFLSKLSEPVRQNVISTPDDSQVDQMSPASHAESFADATVSVSTELEPQYEQPMHHSTDEPVAQTSQPCRAQSFQDLFHQHAHAYQGQRYLPRRTVNEPSWPHVNTVDCYNADDFQGFNTYSTDHSVTLNPGYMLLEEVPSETLMHW